MAGAFRFPILLTAGLALAGRAAYADTAVVSLRPTAAGSAISGTVTLTDTKKGLKVTAVLKGVPAGEHGFHIHEFGSCEEQGKAAGAHYNPKEAKHGHLPKEGPRKAHAGDMGNVTADKDGNAVLEVVLPKVKLSGGKVSVAGRAVILHEKPDDYSQPAGNAGARVACGIIGITGR